MGPDRAGEHHEILNACYLVRLYSRGGRNSIQREERAKAIQRLGAIVRDALNSAQEFEPIITTLVYGLSKSDDPPF